jgi:hypothetical protein
VAEVPSWLAFVEDGGDLVSLLGHMHEGKTSVAVARGERRDEKSSQFYGLQTCFAGNGKLQRKIQEGFKGDEEIIVSSAFARSRLLFASLPASHDQTTSCTTTLRHSQPTTTALNASQPSLHISSLFL